MIKFRISGAGGGKTTGLVEEIYYRYLQLAEYKKIYVITYTNYAVKQIIQNYINKYGYLPDNIKIMTVHKFCIKEIINPYYQYVFNKTPIENIVTCNYNHKRRFSEFSRYLLKKSIHTDNIFSMSKWILCGKSGFDKKQRKLCEDSFNYFSSDIDSIFIDEYQDLDIDILSVMLKIIDDTSIYMSIVGDPKQHIMGKDYSQKFIYELEKRNIIPNYSNYCYRCGKNVIELSNKLCNDREKQNTDIPDMTLKYLFYEDLEQTINNLKSNKGKILIYMKETNKFYSTDKKTNNDFKINLQGISSFDNKYINKMINLIAKNNKYNMQEKITKIKNLIFEFKIELTKELKFQLLDYLKNNTFVYNNSFTIYSINKVKGLEADYCFYIIDDSFLKYLEDEDTINMESNKIYVALTRVKKELYIVIPKNFKRIKDLEKLGIKRYI